MTNSNKPSLLFFRNQGHFLKECFAIHDEELFQKFNSSVERLCYFTLEMDKIVDNDYDYKHLFETQNNTLFIAIKSHQEGIKILTKVFPDQHEFWSSIDEHNAMYYGALLKEKYDTVQKPVFTLSNFEDYAVKKHTLAYIPIIGLNFLFESKHNIEKLKEIYTLIFKGIQMNDDIEDFGTDILNDQWTYARSLTERFIAENNLSNESNMERFEERVFYVSGIAEELIRYSKESFIQAKNIAQENNFNEIALWLDETISGITRNEELVLNLTKN